MCKFHRHLHINCYLAEYPLLAHAHYTLEQPCGLTNFMVYYERYPELEKPCCSPDIPDSVTVRGEDVTSGSCVKCDWNFLPTPPDHDTLLRLRFRSPETAGSHSSTPREWQWQADSTSPEMSTLEIDTSRGGQWQTNSTSPETAASQTTTP